MRTSDVMPLLTRGLLHENTMIERYTLPEMGAE